MSLPENFHEPWTKMNRAVRIALGNLDRFGEGTGGFQTDIINEVSNIFLCLAKPGMLDETNARRLANELEKLRDRLK